MSVQACFSCETHQHAHQDGAAIAVGVFEGVGLSKNLKSISADQHKALTRQMEAEQFSGKEGQTLVTTLPCNDKGHRVYLVGLGKKEDVSLTSAQEAGGRIWPFVRAHKVTTLSLEMDEQGADFAQGTFPTYMAHGFSLRSWAFEKYMTTKPDSEKMKDVKIHVLVTDVKNAELLHTSLEAVAAGVFTARELVSEPPNVLYPQTFAERVKGFENDGLKVEILNQSQLEKLGMGALLGVGQGSEKDSYVAVMQWKGGTAGDAPVAFVGKGVCFDTGGISLKPSRSMEDMKFDMGGAAAVCGTMRTLALRKARVNAVGVIGLVENMPSGSAIRPSDVLTSMSGKTIEVLNTDAEGRLVLADVLHYTNDRFKPHAMINLATLTGAILVSLADVYTGLFSNDDTLSARLFQSGQDTGERVWRFPMGKEYDRMIKSSIADVANISTSGYGAGSITAAQFLKKFVGETPWAHLDIAGTVWTKSPKPLADKGATGVGVRLLNNFIQKYYEN